MKPSKLFLASMVMVALVSLFTVQGQYETTSTYSSSTSTAGSTSSVGYGQNYPAPVGQTTGTYQVPAVSQAPVYLTGTILSIRDENSMYVNFTRSNIPGMQGVTLILLPRPVSMRALQYFLGKELSFSLLGHDILGRPICDVYFSGIPIEEYFSVYGYYSTGRGYYSPMYYGYYSPMYEYYSPQYGYYPSQYGYYGYYSPVRRYYSDWLA